MLAGALALGSCGPRPDGTIPHAVVDCVAADAALIAATASAMRSPAAEGGCASGAGTDWRCVRDKAIAVGVAIGGCAFLRIATEPPAAEPSAAAPPAGPAASGQADDRMSEGIVEFERYRSEIAGGAVFRTADGER